MFFRKDPLKIVLGEGQYMFDENGTKYLDCINNVAHVGHSHPHVTKAAMEQMSLLSTNSRYLHDNLVLYAKRITEYFPKKLSVTYFVNSGSEANDLAIRLARAHTGNKDVICLEGAYHGHLTTTIDISPYKFEKINGYKKKNWVHVAPIPCNYRGKYTREKYSDEEIGDLYAQEVQTLINNAHVSNRKIGAFICESMVCCAGQVILPPNYLRSAFKYVRDAGGVCIIDEVQTGFGRVGSHMWAFETQGSDVVPDIVTIGKPIGNGHPVACVVTTREIAQSFDGLGVEYFNTYGGNPVSIAIANSVLDVIENENLREHANTVGNYLIGELNKLKNRYSVIGDVRGLGLFIGIDVVKNRLTKEPGVKIAEYVARRFKEERIIMSVDGKYENVLKFKPPMVFSMENAQHWLEILKKIFNETESKSINGNN